MPEKCLKRELTSHFPRGASLQIRLAVWKLLQERNKFSGMQEIRSNCKVCLKLCIVDYKNTSFLCMCTMLASCLIVELHPINLQQLSHTRVQLREGVTHSYVIHYLQFLLYINQLI